MGRLPRSLLGTPRPRLPLPAPHPVNSGAHRAPPGHRGSELTGPSHKRAQPPCSDPHDALLVTPLQGLSPQTRRWHYRGCLAQHAMRPSQPGKALHNTVLCTHPKHAAFPARRGTSLPRALRARANCWTHGSNEGSLALLRRQALLLPLPPPHGPLSPPLCPSPLPPEFWFELVTGSNHHIPQAAGAGPGTGAGAIPPGRVWERGGGESAASRGKGAVPRAAQPPSPPTPAKESP